MIFLKISLCYCTFTRPKIFKDLFKKNTTKRYSDDSSYNINKEINRLNKVLITEPVNDTEESVKIRNLFKRKKLKNFAPKSVPIILCEDLIDTEYEKYLGATINNIRINSRNQLNMKYLLYKISGIKDCLNSEFKFLNLLSQKLINFEDFIHKRCIYVEKIYNMSKVVIRIDFEKDMGSFSRLPMMQTLLDIDFGLLAKICRQIPKIKKCKMNYNSVLIKHLKSPLKQEDVFFYEKISSYDEASEHLLNELTQMCKERASDDLIYNIYDKYKLLRIQLYKIYRHKILND